MYLRRSCICAFLRIFMACLRDLRGLPQYRFSASLHVTVQRRRVSRYPKIWRVWPRLDAMRFLRWPKVRPGLLTNKRGACSTPSDITEENVPGHQLLAWRVSCRRFISELRLAFTVCKGSLHRHSRLTRAVPPITQMTEATTIFRCPLRKLYSEPQLQNWFDIRPRPRTRCPPHSGLDVFLNI